MRVLIVEPGQYPREADIDGSLDTLQHIVGGLIETLYPWEDRAVLICNDEGKLMGLRSTVPLRTTTSSRGPFLSAAWAMRIFAA